MKKTLLLAAALAAPAFAGEAPLAPPPIVTPTPAPACCPLSVEVAGVYGFAMGDIYDGGVSKDIDVYGADITAVYAINDNHSVNLRFGYTFGDECMHGAEYVEGGAVYGSRWETDVHTFVLMPGYRYTHAINDKWSAYIGGNIGIGNVSVKDWQGSSWSSPEEGSDGYANKAHDSDWGLAWSVEVGVSYKMSDNWHAFATYGLFGTTAEPDVRYDESAEVSTGGEIDQQWYQGIRLGVGCQF